MNAIPETKALTRPCLARITLRGFKTIRELEDFELGPISVLIGPNGAGKTNFISFFRLMSWALTPPGNLQTYVAQLGGASMLLHDGPKVTSAIVANLEIRTSTSKNRHDFNLLYAAGDTLVFSHETYLIWALGGGNDRPGFSFGSDHKESILIEHAEAGNETAKTILGMLRRMIVHQFHDTSPTSRIRTNGTWKTVAGSRKTPRILRPFSTA